MSIIWICGVSASGKSTIVRNIFNDLGEPYLNRCKSKKFNYNIRCYRRGGVLTVGRKLGHVTSGLDGVMVGIEKFTNFLRGEHNNWKHLLLDGNKFIDRELMHDYLLKERFDYKIYYICPPLKEIIKRSKKRNNGNDKRFLEKESLRQKNIDKYEKIYDNKNYKKNIIKKQNINLHESKKITEEILCTIKE